ncbi:hypothetical protein Z517_10124 [Fonsecaea pedrosoi CBS 271.37]|uniref:Unplaced genomic scaffold supercont1.7, whole genome shotgun sequence n=1 Tax=Fonsecaea pedrosoi CBS 271.37 TaxID=1442368 RepID=A0A0D2G3Q3_9EURO|nr:uncharacterized protein Z517_10124 [Fonsecaea pedrosoi CBS 271.37]KAH0847030.1 hypothetical protein FOPE_12690 [Fonsecaea pedrosoi]KIW75383.1 hypothetical protein Z517_10124 [Fonsecaea pedrosoi CBS 271.37]
MPVMPSEENTESHIFDKVAKESSDSTASDHPIHKGEQKAQAHHHQSKGPQISDSIPAETKSKEELKAQAQEMNK